jgi:hypothetical protein
MKRTIFVLLVLIILLPACGPIPTPRPTPDIPATTSAMSGTIVAGTLTALPTATSISTETPLPPTETPTTLPQPTGTATPTETTTPIPLEGQFSPAGVGGGVPIGTFRIENNTKEKVNVSINGVTKPGDKPVYYSYSAVTSSFNFDILWGDYQYVVYIGTKKMMSGAFIIRNDDKTTMRIYMDKVVVVGP